MAYDTQRNYSAAAVETDKAVQQIHRLMEMDVANKPYSLYLLISVCELKQIVRTMDLKRFDEALVLYNKALALTREIGALLDHAVTHVNMAHMYEAWEGIESEKIAASLSRAESLLLEEIPERTPYYAFVAEKCAPAFDYFGYFLTANTLRQASKEIYERS